MRPSGLSADPDLRAANSLQDIELARALFVEYAHWLKVDLCFQGFAAELKNLPGAYAPPRGCLLVAGPPGSAFACIALRPLELAGQGEVKRLYVQPAQRGHGWGRRLALALIQQARTIGYRELKLDTLDWMVAARSLYGVLGFRECEAYYINPLPGVVYMNLKV